MGAGVSAVLSCENGVTRLSAELILGENTYTGVVLEMTDEAGNDTMCFSAKGDNNETIWGVKYLLP